MRPDLVLFDLDGTLADSVPDLAWAVDEAMRAVGLPARGEAKVRDWVGNGAERLVRRALTDRFDGEPDDALFARAYPIFLERYAASTSTRSRLYPGVIEGLDALARAGLHLGCVTNKPHRFTVPLLDALGIAGRFRIVVSGDTLREKKPHPMPLLHAASRLGVPPEHGWMVGDSISDVRAARAAGFAIVCTSYGYNHGLDIRDAGPDAVIDSIAELPALIGAVSP